MNRSEFISLSALSKTYPKSSQAAINNINLIFPKGQKIALLGNNGAGKTTLLHVMLGLVPFDSGQIQINGTPLTKKSNGFRKKVGIVPSFDVLINDFTVIEYLKFVAKYHNINWRTNSIEAIKLCDYFEIGDKLNDKLSSLSKGQKTKVSIVASHIHQPSWFVFDEPFSNLDIGSREKLIQLFRNMGNDKLVIISSHDLDLVLSFCDRFIVLSKGKVILDSTKSQFSSTNELENTIKSKLL